MSGRPFIHRAIAAGCIALPVSLSVHAQGALKPLDARVVNTPSQPVPVTVVTPQAPAVTHMGVAAKRHVSLGTASGGSDVCGDDAYATLRPIDGSFAGGPFIVPAGKALVITDAGFGFAPKAPNTWSVGTTLTFDLIASGAQTMAWQHTIVVDAATAAAGRAWRTERILSGVLFGPGKAVCMRAGLNFEGSNGGVFTTTLNVLQGYLVDY